LKNKNKFSNISKDEAIKYILLFYNKNNKVPVNRDFRVHKGYPSSYTICKLFGSWKNAIEKSGLLEKVSGKHKNSMSKILKTKEELLEDLAHRNKIHLKSNLTLMSMSDINNHKDMVSYATYIKHFKSIENMYDLIEYNYKEFNRDNIKKDMMSKYIQLGRYLNKTPNSRDIDKFHKKVKGYSCKTYLEYFGSLYNLQKISGLKIDKMTISKNISKNEALELFKELYGVLGENIRSKDINESSNMPSYLWYVKNVGCLYDMCDLLGFKYNQRKFFCSKNVQYNSYYEVQLAEYLNSKNISFTSEDKYKKHIDGLNKNYRFDFVINEDLFIEIFGITGNDKYNQKIKEKINLCIKNNLNLIDLYPEDFNKDKCFIKKLERFI
jgi:hypothetical protein